MRSERTAPTRAAEGARYLAELGSQGALLFRTVVPLGPDALSRLLAARALVPSGRGVEGRAPAVLDLLLRLSEVVGADSGYAKILRGGAAAFTRLGYDATRIEDLLEAGGVSPRTFYQFFRNKAEVLGALMELFLAVLFDITRHGLEQQGAPLERLRRIVRQLVGGVAIIEGLAHVMIAEALRPGSPVEAMVEQLRGGLAAQLEPVYRELAPGLDQRWVRVRVMALMGALLELRPTADASVEELLRAEELLLELVAPPALASGARHTQSRARG